MNQQFHDPRNKRREPCPDYTGVKCGLSKCVFKGFSVEESQLLIPRFLAEQETVPACGLPANHEGLCRLFHLGGALQS